VRQEAFHAVFCTACGGAGRAGRGYACASAPGRAGGPTDEIAATKASEEELKN
jgi:hypothetical protein